MLVLTAGKTVSSRKTSPAIALDDDSDTHITQSKPSQPPPQHLDSCQCRWSLKRLLLKADLQVRGLLASYTWQASSNSEQAHRSCHLFVWDALDMLCQLASWFHCMHVQTETSMRPSSIAHFLGACQACAEYATTRPLRGTGAAAREVVMSQGCPQLDISQLVDQPLNTHPHEIVQGCLAMVLCPQAANATRHLLTTNMCIRRLGFC